jgi:hypothetical protein
MQRKERLMATLAGKPVDRPAVCFYEINGLDEHPEGNDPFNIYTHPSWLPLIELAREKSDRIVMRSVPFLAAVDPLEEVTTRTAWYVDGSRYEKREIRCPGRTLTEVTRRDPEVNTVWQVEHLFKDSADVEAYLDLPLPTDPGEPDTRGVLEAETALGESGIVMIDTSDPLCIAAALFHMADYTVLALSQPQLFHRLLERFAADLQQRTEAVARALPGRLWRIYGPEYASPPYLPPRLFHEYVVGYDTPMVKTIQAHGGYARIHSHGRLRLILDAIAATGCSGLDPIEPPPQGDLRLGQVRQQVGEQMVLFGNLEASDLENLNESDFRRKVREALTEGPGGRGFVLMPSSCPYGRVVTAQALRNYQVMIEEVED